MSSFKQFYLEEVVPKIKEKFNYQNFFEVPKLEKICLNMGISEANQNPNVLEDSVAELTQIAGQKAVITRAKKSVSAFNVRKDMPVGCRVTLRGGRMYEFYNKLVNVVLPQIRDFRGVSLNSFDGRGNYSIGLDEQIIFPEIEYDKVNQVRGLDIVIVTSAKTDEEAMELLRLMGMPFREGR